MRKEPALIVQAAVIIVSWVVLTFFDRQLNEEMTMALTTIFTLIGGWIIRENVYAPATVEEMVTGPTDMPMPDDHV